MVCRNKFLAVKMVREECALGEGSGLPPGKVEFVCTYIYQCSKTRKFHTLENLSAYGMQYIRTYLLDAVLVAACFTAAFLCTRVNVIVEEK